MKSAILTKELVISGWQHIFTSDSLLPVYENVSICTAQHRRAKSWTGLCRDLLAYMLDNLHRHNQHRRAKKESLFIQLSNAKPHCTSGQTELIYHQLIRRTRDSCHMLLIGPIDTQFCSERFLYRSRCMEWHLGLHCVPFFVCADSRVDHRLRS